MDYELLDFGAGRKLERFGNRILDRPSPAAEPFRKENPSLWKKADLVFVADSTSNSGGTPERGRWKSPSGASDDSAPWTLSFPPLTFELKCTPFGHLGIFPEQLPNWNRISELLRSVSGDVSPTPSSIHSDIHSNTCSATDSSGSSTDPSGEKRGKESEERSVSARILNLFAYTGGSTLISAASGAQVVHVDSAKNVVSWARKNAELSGLQNAPIRWLSEDAAKFVQREVRKNAQYDGIILDPPSFGHGPRGEQWNISKQLPELLRNCFFLLRSKPIFLLLTCHSPQFELNRLVSLVRSHVKTDTRCTIEPLSLKISSATGRFLPSGWGVFCQFPHI